jgi:hypothetical protein
MFVSCIVCCVGSNHCVELITDTGGVCAYVYLVSCDLEAPKLAGLGLILTVSPQKN